MDTAVIDRPMAEFLHWQPKATISKWHREEDWLTHKPCDETVEVEGNLLLNAGITKINTQLIGTTTAPFNAANCRVGVGDTNTAAAASQTDLAAAATSSNRRWELCDSVNNSAQTITIVATFQTGDGNFAWQEWGIDQGTADGSGASVAAMLNRKVASMGTKAAGSVWVFTVTITIA